jgi:hypothetical protein
LKIGFSFGRCLRDIVKGEVVFDDVLCIIARTRMETEEHVRGVVSEYMHRRGYLLGLDQDTCEQIGLQLFSSGKILEPRANGINPMSVPRDYVWMDLFPTVPNAASDAVQQAWEGYRLLITLTEQLPEDDFVPQHSEKILDTKTTNELQAEDAQIHALIMNSI